MKILFLLSTFLISFFSFSQETEFKTSQDYITDYLVTPCDSTTKEEIYKKTIAWISVNFKNSKEVIQSQIENEMIRIEGFTENFNGTSNALYTIEISFKDGKYKFDPLSFTIINGLNTFDYFTTYSSYFKKNGDVKERLKVTVNGVNDLFNGLNHNLKNYIIGKSKKDDW